MSTARLYKTRYFAKSFAITSVICLFLIISVKFIFAQTQPSSRTLVVSPPTVTENFDPGAQKEGKMKLTNISQQDTLTFKAVIRDFIVADTKGTPLIEADLGEAKRKYAASSWIGIYPSTFTLKPGQSENLTYFIQVPKDARPGGRYASIVFESQNGYGPGGSGASVETHIGTLFIFRINGQVVENASVKSFSTDKKIYEYGPANILTQILNSSDTHIKPVGTVMVKNLIGQTVDSQNLEDHNIFPEAVRDFNNTVGKKFMFGMYTAELHATYGDKNNLTLFASTTFFVFPWKIAGIVALAVIVIILLIIYLRRRKKKGTHHEEQPQQPQPQMPQQPQVPVQG